MTWGRNDLETKWPGGEMTGNHTSKLNCSSCRGVALRLTPETCRFKGKDDFKDEIWLKVVSLILKKHTPRKATLYFFYTRKVSTVIFIEGGLPPSRSQNDKTSTFDNLFPPLRHSRQKSRKTRYKLTRNIAFFPPKWRRCMRAHYLVLRKFCPRSRRRLNPLNPKIKIGILICCPYSFPTEVVGRSW